MSRSRRRCAAVLATLAGLLGPLLLGGTLTAHAVETFAAYGTIKFPHKDHPKVEVLWFDKDWGYIDRANAVGDSYSINLEPGTYHLQFVDKRPSYDTKKYAPTDITVKVSDRRVRKNVTMTKGAIITGTAKAHGKVAKKATVIAANEQELSFSTVANKKGQFALGGLPAGAYSVFVYDHKHRYVDKSTWAGRLAPAGSTNLAINLKKKAGNLRVYLHTSAHPQQSISGRPTVTAVSKKTGQFWSVRAKGGSAVFQGLYPGRYKLVANGFGVWFGRTGAVKGGKVKAGRTSFGDFTYTKRGGWLTGTVVDGSNPSIALEGATVQLWSATGDKLDETISDADGSFTLDGLLATQSDLTVVVAPGPYSDYLGRQGQECQYVATSHPGASVTAGKQSALGQMSIDRLPDGNCNAPTA